MLTKSQCKEKAKTTSKGKFYDLDEGSVLRFQDGRRVCQFMATYGVGMNKKYAGYVRVDMHTGEATDG